MFDYDLTYYATVESTNSVIKKAIQEGSPEGAVVVAREQTEGYGRQGRSWASPKGGLYLSLLLKPHEHGVTIDTYASLSLVIALAVRRAILAFFALEQDVVQLKWPNDLVSEQGKIAGISVEVLEKSVCVGVGVNVFRPAVSLDVEGKNTPCFLQGLTSKHYLTNDQRRTLDGLTQAFLTELDAYYEQWCTQGFASFVEEYESAAALTNKEVRIADRAGNIEQAGRVVGINAQGHLRIETSSGVETIVAGEAHLL